MKEFNDKKYLKKGNYSAQVGKKAKKVKKSAFFT